jgi:phosphate transport system permease protein
VTFLVNSAARLIVASSTPGGKRTRKVRRVGDKDQAAQTEGATP